MVGHLPDIAVLALPDSGDVVARPCRRPGVAVDDVVGDVELAAGVPVA
ncbi:MAG: hypothetical protein U5K37_02205 [Natrialbaceae archaeon]|nr:hypothetical protein [Natrialbaceae archaeon]